MRMMTKRAARAAVKCPLLGAQKTNIPVLRESVPGGGDFCGGEEHRAGVGARSALQKLTHRGCPSGESEANAASSAVRPQPEHRSEVDTKCDRHSMSFRRVPAPATRARSMEGDANIETVL